MKDFEILRFDCHSGEAYNRYIGTDGSYVTKFYSKREAGLSLEFMLTDSEANKSYYIQSVRHIPTGRCFKLDSEIDYRGQELVIKEFLVCESFNSGIGIRVNEHCFDGYDNCCLNWILGQSIKTNINYKLLLIA